VFRAYGAHEEKEPRGGKLGKAGGEFQVLRLPQCPSIFAMTSSDFARVC
jgi:hypothetical protein